MCSPSERVEESGGLRGINSEPFMTTFYFSIQKLYCSLYLAGRSFTFLQRSKKVVHSVNYRILKFIYFLSFCYYYCPTKLTAHSLLNE